MHTRWPALIINLKQIVTGGRISKYVVTAAQLARQYRYPLIVCTNNAEIQVAVEAIKNEDISLFYFFHIFGQSIDPAGEERTGAITPQVVARLGAHGTLLNHYEARIYGHKPGEIQQKKGEQNDRPEDFLLLKKTILEGLGVGLSLVVCADGPETAKEVAAWLSGEEFKEQTYDNFYQRLLDQLDTQSYVELEKVFGRFPEGLSKGSFRRMDFMDTFFGLLTKETSQRSYERFIGPFTTYQRLLKEAMEEILLRSLREQLFEPVIAYAYRRIAIAVEWDEFIGKAISIVEKKPEVIRESVQAVRAINEAIPVYCGAGVKTADEILTAKEYGAIGSLAASAFAKPFRRVMDRETNRINWEESLSWAESVERYLQKISKSDPS